MPNRMTRTAAIALMTAFPLSFAPAVWAQTEPSETAPAPAAEPAPSAGGPKRLKAPEQEGGAAAAEESGAAEAEVEEATTSETLPETDEAEMPAAADETAAEPAAEAAEGATVATEGDVVVTEEAGTGPFVGDYTIGDPDAPVQVIEYASFTCPHCAAYHQESYPELKEDFIETDRIGFTLREVYFDRFGLWASMAARCGGEAAFYPLADRFMKKQAEWTGAEDIAQAIAQIARRAGLTDAQLKGCLENQDFAKLLVADYQQNAAADEIRSTPTFVVRGPDGTETVVGNKPEELREAIESALPAG